MRAGVPGSVAAATPWSRERHRQRARRSGLRTAAGLLPVIRASGGWRTPVRGSTIVDLFAIGSALAISAPLDLPFPG